MSAERELTIETRELWELSLKDATQVRAHRLRLRPERDGRELLVHLHELLVDTVVCVALAGKRGERLLPEIYRSLQVAVHRVTNRLAELEERPDGPPRGRR